MAKFTLTITCDNAAFEDGGGETEVARILRETAERVEDGTRTGNLLDINGNVVGSYTFSQKWRR